MAQARMTQDVTLMVGWTYTLSFATYFNYLDAGFTGVMFNQVPQKTVDARDNSGPNV